MLFDEKEFLERCDIKVRNHTGWWYKNKPLTEVPEGYVGFTYVITCINKNNEFYGWNYYGLKHFYSKTTKKLGKKAIAALPDKRMSKKVKIVKESLWKSYNTSNKELQILIEKNPTHFKKEILGLYKTEKQLTYGELKLIVCNDALTCEKNWNGWLHSGKIFKKELCT